MYKEYIDSMNIESNNNSMENSDNSDYESDEPLEISNNNLHK